MTNYSATRTVVAKMVAIASIQSPAEVMTLALVGDVLSAATATVLQTLASNAQSGGSVRVVRGELTLLASGSTTFGSNSAAGVRGVVTVPSGATLSDGYMYGVQGKLVIQGAVSSVRQCQAALLGQLDLSTSGTITNALIAALWLDAGPTSAVTPTPVAMMRITNTTTKKVNSLMFVEADASYFGVLNDTGNGGQDYLATKAVGTYSGKSLKCSVNGIDLYIPLNTLS